MKDYPLLTSVDNAKIKHAVKLADRRERNKSGLFLIEGYRELQRALLGRETLETLYICPELFLGTNEGDLIASAEKSGAKVYLVTERVFRKVSYRDRPDGLL